MQYTVLDTSLDVLIKALCADYKRREALLLSANPSSRVQNEFRYLNFKIRDAICEVVGERLCGEFLTDIGGRVGYARTPICCLAEGTYKNYKSEAKANIAKKLYLLG